MTVHVVREALNLTPNPATGGLSAAMMTTPTAVQIVVKSDTPDGHLLTITLEPYLGGGVGYGGDLFLFVFGGTRGGGHRGNVLASISDAERLGHYLLDVDTMLRRISSARSHSGRITVPPGAPFPASPPPSLFGAQPPAPLTPTPVVAAAGIVPPFAQASVAVPSYGCAFELPHRRGVLLWLHSSDADPLALRGYAFGPAGVEPAYVLEMGSADPNAPKARVTARQVLSMASVAALGHALLDAVTEQTGRLTDRP